ncbi:MAG: GNAT family N-acetyltransferase [Candidatus Heimdallarchaeota archaeon]|nr:GNAT family N-acetyltransferase [Candidatus Heimdallarchaeota archaeon]
MTIIPFEARKLNESQLQELYDLQCSVQEEIFPEDSHLSFKLWKELLINTNSHYTIFRWLAVIDRKERIIGCGRLSYPNEDSPMFENMKNIADFDIIVESDERRKGIGKSLLAEITAKADSLERHSLQNVTIHKHGKAFCDYFGCTVASERSVNRLYLADVNWKRMREWVELGKIKAPNTKVETFEAVPKDCLEEFVAVYTQTENQAPDYETGYYQGLKVTPESRRHNESMFKEKGYVWTTKISREENGSISGLTEIFYNPEIPNMVEQELTGVLPEYRERGLGKWLKAAMAFYVKSTYPSIEFIQTGNANNNETMNAINKRMGFKPVCDQYLVKLDTSSIIEKLNEKK